jgi:hypothetical protein
MAGSAGEQQQALLHLPMPWSGGGSISEQGCRQL